MSKRKILFTVFTFCLLGLFLLSMSGGQSYAKDEGSEENLETSDALKQQQDSTVDYKSRGRSYLKKGQIDDAISDLNKAGELNPEDAGAYFYRGNAYYKKGQSDKAISDRDLYQQRMRDNKRVGDMGVAIRQSRTPPIQ